MALELRVRAHSETGLVRKENQDSGFVSPSMLIVADGMGGAAAGDLASRVAVDELRRADGQGTGEDMLDVLDDAARRANDRLADLIEQDPDLEGMGTTICGGLFDGRDLGVVHLGDSRGYLVRDGHMLRLTHDHSWVQSLIDEGRLDEDAAFSHPHRSLLLRVLNGQPYSRPDLLLVTLNDGDRLLFCTDGLCGIVDDPDIAASLSQIDPREALAGLIAAAHEAGGSDNITLVLADVVDPGGPVDDGEATTRLERPDRPGEGPGTPTLSGPAPAATVLGDRPRPVEEPDVVGDHDGAAATVLGDRPRLAATPPPEPGAGATSNPAAPDGATVTGAASPASPAATATSPLTPPGALPAGVTTPAGSPSGVWADVRPMVVSAPPVVAEGRAAGLGRLIGAAARATPLSLSAADRGGADRGEAEAAEPAIPLAGVGRSSRRPADGRRRRGPWIAAGAVLGVVAVAVGWLLVALDRQYFVGVDAGQVAIFSGLPGSIAGLSTHHLVERTTVALTDLPLSQRPRLLQGVAVDDLAAARDLADKLLAQSQACLERRAQRQDPSSPTSAPGTAVSPSTPAVSPSLAVSPRPTVSPGPSPTGSATASTPGFPDDGC